MVPHLDSFGLINPIPHTMLLLDKFEHLALPVGLVTVRALLILIRAMLFLLDIQYCILFSPSEDV